MLCDEAKPGKWLIRPVAVAGRLKSVNEDCNSFACRPRKIARPVAPNWLHMFMGIVCFM